MHFQRRHLAESSHEEVLLQKAQNFMGYSAYF